LRFSRLYPLHFITLNLVLILYLIFIFLNVELFSFSEINIKHYLLNILLISNWGFENQASFNTPSWSVSIEMMLYIIFFLTARKKIKIFHSTTLLILFSLFLFYFNKLIGYGFFCFFIGGFTFLVFAKINNYKIKKVNYIIFFLFTSITVIFFINLYKVTDIQFKIFCIFNTSYNSDIFISYSEI